MSNNLKKVRHAEMDTIKSRGMDSEMDQRDDQNMEVQKPDSRGSKEEEQDGEMKFVLSNERYLTGNDIRGLVHLEG